MGSATIAGFNDPVYFSSRRLISGTELDCNPGPEFFIRDELSVQPRRLQTRDPCCLCGHAETGVTIVRTCQGGSALGLVTFALGETRAKCV